MTTWKYDFFHIFFWKFLKNKVSAKSIFFVLLSTSETTHFTDAPCRFTILTHSYAELPVVITSSATTTFAFFFISKPLLNSNWLLAFFSTKIEGRASCFATSKPTTIPPIAGESTISASKFFVSLNMVFKH